MLHYEDGLRLYDAVDEGKLLWTQPYEAIKSSGDDGQRFIWLDFGSDQPEIVSACTCAPSFAGTGPVGQSEAGRVHSALVPVGQSLSNWTVRLMAERPTHIIHLPAITQCCARSFANNVLLMMQIY